VIGAVRVLENIAEESGSRPVGQVTQPGMIIVIARPPQLPSAALTIEATPVRDDTADGATVGNDAGSGYRRLVPTIGKRMGSPKPACVACRPRAALPGSRDRPGRAGKFKPTRRAGNPHAQLSSGTSGPQKNTGAGKFSGSPLFRVIGPGRGK
jgi:hypothetical protein